MMASTAPRLLLVLCCYLVSVSSSVLLQDVNKDSEDDVQCAAEGRFPHPHHCDEYIDCVPDVNGKHLEPHHGSCNGGIFDPYNKKCLAPGKENNCTTRDRHARAITFDFNYDSTCDKIQNGFFCLSCKTLVNCVNGRAYKDDCEKGYTCDMKDTFGGGVCYPNSPTECTCANRRELRVDVYNSHAYLECQSGTQEPTVQFCQKDMIFKGDSLMCEYPVGYVECTKHGIFPSPNDCTEFYKCMPADRGLIQYTMICDCGLLFNELTGECEDPCSYQPVRYSCQAEGRFPDLYDCHSYYICIANTSRENGFSQLHHKCPQRSFWKPGAVVGTGSCQVAGNSSECVSRGAPRCAVPAGRDCQTTPTLTPGGSCIQGSAMCQCNSATGQLSCAEGFSGDGQTCNALDLPTFPPPLTGR